MLAPIPVKKIYTFGLSILSGILLVVSFPPFDLGCFAWFAFVPLFFALKNQKPGKAFLIGWLAGLVYFCGTLYWVTISMAQYGGLPIYLSTLVMLLLVAYLALYLGIFCALIQYCIRFREKELLLFIPALWVVLEFIKGHVFSGFPWASLAYSQTHFLPMIQIADFGSIYSVGFVMIFVNFSIYWSIGKCSFRKGRLKNMQWKPLFIGLSVLLLSYAYGTFRLLESGEGEKNITVSVIQGNIAQDQKWDETFKNETLSRYQRLSSLAVKNSRLKPDLILWPEAALPFIFKTEPKHEAILRNFAETNQVNLLFGAPSIRTLASGKIALLNSAYLIAPETEDISQYDKMHLVPFGEYVPFSDFLFFVDKFVEGIGDFVPGKRASIFKAGEVRIGTVICFEVIFPEVVRAFVKNGAQVMTTITNDAWFGKSAAPYQHFSMVIFRAIENRVSFARAANTGISGFIDAKGRTIQKTALFVETAATATLTLRNQETLYTKFGDFFAGLCAIITLFFLLITILIRRAENAF